MVYIGSSINIEIRLKHHFRELKNNRHKNRHLQNAFNKREAECFSGEVVEFCLPEELLEREQLYIDLYKDSAYNLSSTAENTLGVRYSEEAKQKISIATKGRPSQFKGKHHSLEAKMKDSLANKGKHHSPKTEFQKGRIPWNKGKHLNEELRRKDREAIKRLWQNPEYRQRSIKAQRRRRLLEKEVLHSGPDIFAVNS